MVMVLQGLGVARRGSVWAFVIAATAVACGSQDGSTQPSPSTPAQSGGHTGTSADASTAPSSSSSGAGDDTSSGDDLGPPTSSDDGGGTPASPDGGDDAAGDDAAIDGGAAPDAAPACVKGQVTPNEVVMLGDSYLDPNWGNVGPTIMMDANAKYRPYYIGGASLGWGNPNTQFYIPYQYDPMALTDTAVTNPADIKVIIMDGGGNDVLIGNTSCLTTAPPGNTSCVTTINTAISVATTTMQEMAKKGVQWIVFFFYPHLSTAGGGILTTPAPAVNETLDYAYPLTEQFCCGSSFTSDINNYSCMGSPTPGLNCVFIDTRPSFEGHLADYIKSDNVHPTQAGANVIANLVWTQMQNHCIAQ
jgi:hypothetical protein